MSPRNDELFFFWSIGSIELVFSLFLTPVVFNGTIKGWEDYVGVFFYCLMMISALFLLLGLITRRYLLLIFSVVFHALLAMDFLLHAVFALCRLPDAFISAPALAETYVGFSYGEHIMRHVLDVVMNLIGCVMLLGIAALTFYQAAQSEDKEVPRDIEKGNTVHDC